MSPERYLERLKNYILVPKEHFVDEQGYKYTLTEKSFLPLDSNFKEDLKQAQKEIEKNEIVEHNEFWDEMGL